jgi:hypothetical protein
LKGANGSDVGGMNAVRRYALKRIDVMGMDVVRTIIWAERLSP